MWYNCCYYLLTMTIVGIPVWAMTVVKVIILSMAPPYLHSFMNKCSNILTEIWSYSRRMMLDIPTNTLKKRYSGAVWYIYMIYSLSCLLCYLLSADSLQPCVEYDNNSQLLFVGWWSGSRLAVTRCRTWWSCWYLES